jgi:hypothetical protein
METGNLLVHPRTKEELIECMLREDGPISTTFLDLIDAISSCSSSEEETIAVIHHLISSGFVHVYGAFTEEDIGVKRCV